MGDAMAWETAGGTGVGPAVMRYCLMNGFAVIGGPRRGSWGADGRLASEEGSDGVNGGRPRLLVPPALDVALELLEVPASGQPHDPPDRRRDADDHADDAEDVAGVGLPAARAGVALVVAGERLRAADPRADRARQREEEAEPGGDEREHDADRAEDHGREREAVGLWRRGLRARRDGRPPPL